MESRPYFLFGDLIGNAGVGALSGLAVAALIEPAWPALLAMVVGMLVGDLCAVVPLAALTVLFGAMEVMLPVMLTGMTAGMVAGMTAVMGPLSIGSGAVVGAAAGLVVLFGTYALNALIQRRSRRPSSVS